MGFLYGSFATTRLFVIEFLFLQKKFQKTLLNINIDLEFCAVVRPTAVPQPNITKSNDGNFIAAQDLRARLLAQVRVAANRDPASGRDESCRAA